jgi:hypothetical protein
VAAFAMIDVVLDRKPLFDEMQHLALSQARPPEVDRAHEYSAVGGG